MNVLSTLNINVKNTNLSLILDWIDLRLACAIVISMYLIVFKEISLSYFRFLSFLILLLAFEGSFFPKRFGSGLVFSYRWCLSWSCLWRWLRPLLVKFFLQALSLGFYWNWLGLRLNMGGIASRNLNLHLRRSLCCWSFLYFLSSWCSLWLFESLSLPFNYFLLASLILVFVFVLLIRCRSSSRSWGSLLEVYIQY